MVHNCISQRRDQAFQVSEVISDEKRREECIPPTPPQKKSSMATCTDVRHIHKTLKIKIKLDDGSVFLYTVDIQILGEQQQHME